MTHPDSSDEFDLRARAELSFAYPVDPIPPHLFRHTPWYRRRGLQLGLGALMMVSAVFSTVYALRPPDLVRAAIEHEYYERTLRGGFIEPRTLLAHMGLQNHDTVPGYPQLMRPCEIDSKLVYHLTTFFEKGGLVTVFAFDQPVDLKEESGWWHDVHWQVVRARDDGRPLILVSEKKKALNVAKSVFSRPQV